MDKPAADRVPRIEKATAAALGELSACYQRLYDDLNSDCFDGALPQCTIEVRSWLDLLGVQAKCDHWLKRIEISDALAGQWHGQIERVLLHEICHFRVLGHGDDFQAELRQLATLARYSWVARWAEEEVILCMRQDRRERRELARARRLNASARSSNRNAND